MSLETEGPTFSYISYCILSGFCCCASLLVMSCSLASPQLCPTYSLGLAFLLLVGNVWLPPGLCPGHWVNMCFNGAIPEPSLAFWWRHVFFFWCLVTILPLCQSWPRPMARILVIVSQTQFVVGSGLSVGLVCCGVLAVPWPSYLCPVCYMAPGCLQSVVLLILLPPPPYFPPFFLLLLGMCL